jgi:outer membrane receptor protein involved in Fe transport
MSSGPSGRFRCILAAFLLLAVGAVPSMAQDTGAIAGVVVDAANGETLPGANVSIKGTTTGTSTDLKGRYRITGLEPGSYDVLFSFVGFTQKTVTGVEVEAGETVTVDVSLNEQTAELEEVVVTAEAARDSEAGLLKRRAKAASVSDAISAEAISQAGAGDAAAAMKKVTGASVVGGKYVYVRGLGGRYSNTQLNGVEVPSSDPDRNSVQFDLFQSEALENIVTQKTFTPDQPGNFSGGLVNISTKSFPEDFSLKFSSSVSVNPQVHFNNDFLTQSGGGLDFLGIDDGARAIPDILDGISNEEIPTQTEVTDAIREAPDGQTPPVVDEFDRLSDAFNDNMGAIRGTAPINQSYSFSLGNQQELLGRPLGYIVSLSYGRSATYYDDGFTGRYDNPRAGNIEPTILLNDTEGTDEVNWGGIANLNYKLTPNNEVTANVLYTRSGTQETRFQSGSWPDEFGDDSPNLLQNRTITFTERRLVSTQLQGEHLVPAVGNLLIEWTGAYSDTNQEEPDKRLFPSLVRFDAAGDSSFIAQASGFPFPSRIFRDLTETTQNAKIDFTLPFKQWSGEKARLKFGGLYKRDERDFNETFFSQVPGELSFNAVRGDEEAFFSDENTGVIEIVEQNGLRLPRLGATIQLNTDENNDYQGERVVGAGYLMLDLPVTSKLNVIAGARLESTNQTVGRRGEDLGEISETDILPAVNLRYALTDNMNLRGAASRTLARPTFREFGPFALFSTDIFDFVIGEPGLQRTLITNLDLRWEWFTRPGEILAVSAFYKDMNDPIERALLQSNGQTSWRNVDDADVYGVEAEVRTRLDRIAPSLEYLTLGVNVSFVESVVDVPETELANPDDDTDRTRPLQGQSPYTFNADLTYDNPEWGTTTGLYFNISGERLSAVGLFEQPEAYEQPFAQLDFNFSQKVFTNWSLSFSVDNLLDDNYEERVETLGESRVFQSYEEGRTYSLGLSYSI